MIRWGAENYREFPWRAPEQPWHGLTAEILLQRTRAQSVIPVYLKFTNRFPTPLDLATASVEEIEDVIRPLGLRWRAPLLKRLGDTLQRLYGEVPETEKALRKLPGVGPYAAGAYLSLHANKRSTIIDANIVRFVGRLMDRPTDAESRRKKWVRDVVDALTPGDEVRNFNYALLDFTMEICAPKPHCDKCPVGEQLCAYKHRLSVGSVTPDETD